MHKVLKPFPYAHDHVNSVQLIAGDLVSFHPGVVPGLTEAGYIEETTETEPTVPLETKVVESVPEVGSIVPQEPSSESFVRGMSAGENSEKPNDDDLADDDFKKGFTVGVLKARAQVDLSAWEDLTWPELRSVASRLSDEPVNNREKAVAAVQAELTRRLAIESGMT